MSSKDVVRVELPFDLFTKLRDRADREGIPVDLLITRLFTVIPRPDARRLGLKRFFTGRPCAQGHIAERYVSGSRCVECRREENRKWRQAHPEEFRAKKQAEYAAQKLRVLRGQSGPGVTVRR